MARQCLAALQAGTLSPAASGAFPSSEACRQSTALGRAQPHQGGAKTLQSEAIIN